MRARASHGISPEYLPLPPPAPCAHEHRTSNRPCAATALQLDAAATICSALSDPSRLRLLLWLVEGERCVSELVEYEKAKLSSISARLQTLHAARLVTRRREAKHVFYALADEHVRALLHNILTHAAEAA